MDEQITILGLIFAFGFLIAVGFAWGFGNLLFKSIGIMLWSNLTLIWWLYPLVDKYFPMK